jgi:predicted Zn finger-like uncharacterized protein
MFKVVPDQLRISEGWVRCGHCAEVFDARSHLQSWSSAQQTVAASSQTLVPEPVVEAIQGVEAPFEELAPTVELHAKQDAARAPVAQITFSMPDLPETAPEAPVSLGSMLVNPESVPLPLQDGEDVRNAVLAPVVPALAVAQSASTEPDSVMDEDVSFVREARRQAFWRRPLMRTVMALFSLLLTGALVLQVAVHERDRLAALEPQLKPWLMRLCVHLNCTVGVPRQIESVVIDSSTFNRVRNDVFRLGFMIRNTSGLEVATPAVEVTLTDTQDQPVVRRVFLPAEIGAELSLPPKGEWNAVLNMGVDAQGAAARVSGYRLLAFYP